MILRRSAFVACGASLTLAAAGCAGARTGSPTKTADGRPAPTTAASGVSAPDVRLGIDTRTLRAALADYLFAETTLATCAYDGSESAVAAARAWTAASERLSGTVRDAFARLPTPPRPVEAAAPSALASAAPASSTPVSPPAPAPMLPAPVRRTLPPCPPGPDGSPSCCRLSSTWVAPVTVWVKKGKVKKKVLLLGPIMDLARARSPLVLWLSVHSRVDARALGDALLVALESADAPAAWVAAGLLLAELLLAEQQTGAIEARATKTAGAAPAAPRVDCGPLREVASSLATAPSVRTRTEYLVATCDALAGDEATARRLLGPIASSGGPLAAPAAWRLALSYDAAGEVVLADRTIHDLAAGATPDLLPVAPLLASRTASELGYFDVALADLARVLSARPGPFSLPLVLEQFASILLDWEFSSAEGPLDGDVAPEPPPPPGKWRRCGPVEVTEHFLAGGPLTTPALWAATRAFDDVTRDPFDLYRAIAAREPLGEEALGAWERIYSPTIRERWSAEVERATEAAVVEALGPGSAWRVANAGRPDLLARADALLAAARGPAPLPPRPPSSGVPYVTDSAIVAALEAHRDGLSACYRSSPRSAVTSASVTRLDLNVDTHGEVTDAKATSDTAAGPLERCLGARLRGVRLGESPAAPVSVRAWLVALVD